MFIKSSFIFSSLTMVSRVFGFIRDMLLANYFGIGMFADAFNVAFRLPNLFRSIFAEGAFSAAFVPLFSGKLHEAGKKQALLFAGRILSFLVVALICLMIIFQVFIEDIVMAIAPGFESNPEKFELTLQLTRITSPYLLFISIVTFYACILNSIDRFAAMAASPIILNIVMIIGLTFFGGDDYQKSFYAAYSVFWGGLIQLVAIFIAVWRKEHLPKLEKIKVDKDSGKFFKNLTPAILGSGVTQINIWIGTIIATSIPGAVSIIYYADRLVQLPLALIGVSIGIVILPKLSKLFKSGDMEKAVFLQNRSLEIALVLSIPCSIILYEISEPIIYILFQRGAFSVADTDKTAPALLILGLGIPAYVLNKILVSSFFANQDTKTPVRVSVICVILNAVGNYVLVQYISYLGIAVATAFSAWTNIILLLIYAYKKDLFRFDFAFKIRFIRILLSCIIMYVFLNAIYGLFGKYIFDQSTMISLGVFSAILIASFAIYIVALFFSGVYNRNSIKELTDS